MASKISESLLPLKGGEPQSRMYRTTPADQMSLFSLNLLLSASGEM
jgi:hypothetical protein